MNDSDDDDDNSSVCMAYCNASHLLWLELSIEQLGDTKVSNPMES